jgi:hypothetical protein
VGRDNIAGRHRASYILEQGVWRATCRACGYKVTDPQRRRATSIFRAHIRDASEWVVDLTAASVDHDAMEDTETAPLAAADVV